MLARASRLGLGTLPARFPRAAHARRTPPALLSHVPPFPASDEERGRTLGSAAGSPPSALDAFTGPLAKHFPGFAAAATVAAAGTLVADHAGQALLAAQGVEGGSSPISGIPVAILLGLGLNNVVGKGLPSSFAPGLKLCTTTVLRAGIVCVGAKLSCYDVAKLGIAGVPVVASAVGVGLVVTTQLARLAGLPSRMGSLIAAGTSICGVTAITAVAPVIKASPRDTAVAVANVVAFGTLGMLCYPYVAHALLPASEQVGLFLGTAVHDTSQVMGTAMTYNEIYGDEIALQTAAVTKLTRNMFLAGVIPGIALYNARLEARQGEAAAEPAAGSDAAGSDAADGGAPADAAAGGPPSGAAKGATGPSTAATGSEAPRPAALSGLATFQKYVPSFVLAFVGMTVLRTGGDATLDAWGQAYGALDEDAYRAACKTIGGTCSKTLLTTAMAAVGLSTSASVLRGVGWKPFAVGASSALVVGGTGLAAATAVGSAGLL
jgi:uncharacterized integral membrane protein (TIGR00698 family)